MTDFVQVDHEQFSETSKAASGSRARQLDTRFLLLLAFALLLLIAAAFIAAYMLLQRFFPQIIPTNAAAPEMVGSSPNLTILIALTVLFALIGITLYLVARWQILHDRSLQAAAGCPSCSKRQLLRISRSRRDRVVTLSGIRIARYQCRECGWNGRRIFIKNYHPLQNKTTPDTRIVVPIMHDEIASERPLKPAAKPTAAHKPSPQTAPQIVQEAGSPSDQAADAGSAQFAEEAVPFTTAAEEPLPVADKERHEVPQTQSLNPGQRARIMTKFGVNLRAEPHLNARWIGLLGPETIVSVNGISIQDDGAIWHDISAEGQRGWVTSECLQPL